MSSTSFILFNALVWILLVATGDADRGVAILRRLATSASSLIVTPIFGSGQQSCSEANPCSIQISGFDQGQGIPSKTIDLKADESWSDKTQNVLIFREKERGPTSSDLNSSIPPDWVDYFFIGFYNDALHFACYDQIKQGVIRTKVIGVYDLITLCEQRVVASSSYWHGEGYGAKLYYRLIVPASATTTTTGAGGDTDTTAAGSSLRANIVFGSGQQSCSEANPCSIQISGIDQYQGMGPEIDLKAGESWTAFTQNVLYFREIKRGPTSSDLNISIPSDWVEYFFIGYYDNTLHFAWYDATYNVDDGRIEEAVIRSKVISWDEFIALAEQRVVALSSYWHGEGNGAKVYWKMLLPQTSN
eukprot:291667_1